MTRDGTWHAFKRRQDRPKTSAETERNRRRPQWFGSVVRIIRRPMNCQCEAWKAEVDHGVPCRESFDAQHELNRPLLSDIDVALHILRVQLFLENATMDRWLCIWRYIWLYVNGCIHLPIHLAIWLYIWLCSVALHER